MSKKKKTAGPKKRQLIAPIFAWSFADACFLVLLISSIATHGIGMKITLYAVCVAVCTIYIIASVSRYKKLKK